jgi:DNA replicative helicase MCM subunit Mcm2 (Cdc46/Mcm family)
MTVSALPALTATACILLPCTAVPQEPLSLPFLKKYIAFAKQRFAAPELTPEASDAIAGWWEA